MSEESRYKTPSLEKIVNKLIGFIFYWRLCWVLIAIGVIIYFSIYTYNNSTPVDRFRNLGIVLTGGSIIIGIFYSILNYEHIQIKYKNDVKSSIGALTFNAASEWHRPTMVENLKITKQLYDENKHLIDDNKAVDFFNILEKNESARSALVSIFNYLECISLGIDHGILDNEFMKEYFASIFSLYSTNYGFYITYRRNVNNSPKTWINFTKLAQKWADGK